MNRTGVPLEITYPYQNNDTYYTKLGKPICSTNSSFVKLKNPFTGLYFYNSLTVQQLQQLLVDNGPLSVGVYAGHNGFYYPGASGKVVCPSGNIDHAVLLVGYNSTHWFIKNSWGTNWGDNGYGYISKTNDCGMRTYVNVVSVSTSNTNPTGNLTLTVTLTDSFGDGWNGNVLVIRQGSINVAFGSTFTTGRTFGPLSIQVNSNAEVTIEVSVLGTKTNQIGFTVRLPNGTVVYTRNPGTTFTSSTVFSVFCPSSACTVASTVDYYLTMTDSYGDGWNGNVLAFVQGSTRTTFGSQMVGNLKTFGPVKFTFRRF